MKTDGFKPQKKIIYPIGMLDFCKGISMLLIILVHCRGYGAKNLYFDRAVDALSSSAVMFFQIAAGFGIRKTSPAKMLKKTAKENLLPYAFCGICAVILKLPVRLVFGQHSLRQALKETAGIATAFFTGTMRNPKTLFGIPNGSVGPAWFLLALFWGIQIVNLILRIGDKRKEIVAAVVLTGIGRILNHLKFGYCCIDCGFACVFPIYLGYHLRREHLLDKIPQWVSMLLTGCLGICGAAVFLTLPDSSWFIKECGKNLIFYSAALLMLLFSVMCCGNKKGMLSQMICYIGKNSFLFLIVHTIEYESMPWRGLVRVLGWQKIPELGNMLCFLLRTAGCAAAVRLMEQPFNRMITGRSEIKVKV